jgi:predicted nucleic acid-binding protein
VIVLDASVVVDLLLGTQAAGPLAARIRAATPWHAPAVLDLEVANAIRRLCAIHQTSEERGSRAITDLAALPVRRYPHTPLLERIWQLRANLTAYDAAYVALAETLRVALVTRDRRLAKTRGHRARIDVV